MIFTYGLPEKKEKKIYCPRCGRKVATWDGEAKTNIDAKCKKCGKLIVFHQDTGEVERKDMPPRVASGIRFY